MLICRLTKRVFESNRGAFNTRALINYINVDNKKSKTKKISIIFKYFFSHMFTHCIDIFGNTWISWVNRLTEEDRAYIVTDKRYT